MSDNHDVRVEVSRTSTCPKATATVNAVISVTVGAGNRDQQRAGAGHRCGAPAARTHGRPGHHRRLLGVDGIPAHQTAEAKAATAAAIDALRDGASFAVVAGTDVARMVYPTEPAMVAASAGSRAQAQAAVRALVGQRAAPGSEPWLLLAKQLLAGQDAEIKARHPAHRRA